MRADHLAELVAWVTAHEAYEQPTWRHRRMPSSVLSDLVGELAEAEKALKRTVNYCNAIQTQVSLLSSLASAALSSGQAGDA
jgi:hypothetical protein